MKAQNEPERHTPEGPGPTVGWPDFAYQFVELFARTERLLKDAGKSKRGRKVAEADWEAFAQTLPADFFGCVVRSGRAEHLIAEPPRTRLPGERIFAPEVINPLASTVDLLVRGVCRVRNNLVHGEKFGVAGPEWDRDLVLTQEAHWVLELALQEQRRSSGAV